MFFFFVVFFLRISSLEVEVQVGAQMIYQQQLVASGYIGNSSANGQNATMATSAQQDPLLCSPVPLSAASQLAGNRILFQVQQLGQHNFNQIPNSDLVASIDGQGETANALVASHGFANSSMPLNSSLAGAVGLMQKNSEISGMLTGAGPSRVGYLARPTSDVDSVEFDSEDSSTWHIRDRCIVDDEEPPSIQQQQQYSSVPSRSLECQNSTQSGQEIISHPLECTSSDGRQKKSPKRSKGREKKKAVGVEHGSKSRSDHKHNMSFDQERISSRGSSRKKNRRQVRSVSIEINAKDHQNGATIPCETAAKEIPCPNENVSVVQEDTASRGTKSEKQVSPVDKSCLSLCRNPTETCSFIPESASLNTRVSSQVSYPGSLCLHNKSSAEPLSLNSSACPQAKPRTRTDECIEAPVIKSGSGSGCDISLVQTSEGTTSLHLAAQTAGMPELSANNKVTADPQPTESMLKAESATTSQQLEESPLPNAATISEADPVTPVAESTEQNTPGLATTTTNGHLIEPDLVVNGESIISHENRSPSISDLSSISLDSRPGSAVSQAAFSSRSFRTKSRSRCSEASCKTDASYRSDEIESRRHSVSHSQVTRRGNSFYNEESGIKVKSGSLKRDILNVQDGKSSSNSKQECSRLNGRGQPKQQQRESSRQLHDGDKLKANSQLKEHDQRIDANMPRRDIPESESRLQTSRHHSESRSKTQHRESASRALHKPSLSVSMLHYSGSRCASLHHSKSKRSPPPSRSHQRNHLSSSHRCHSSSSALHDESSSRSNHNKSSSRLENSHHHSGSRLEPVSKLRHASTSMLERESNLHHELNSDRRRQSESSSRHRESNSSHQLKHVVAKKCSEAASSRSHRVESRSIEPRHLDSRSRSLRHHSESKVDERQDHRNGLGHRRTSSSLHNEHGQGSHVKLGYDHRRRSRHEDRPSLRQRKHQLDNSTTLSPPLKRSKKDHFRHSTPNSSKQFTSGTDSHHKLNCDDDDSSSVVTLGSLDDPVTLEFLGEEENVQTSMNRSVDDDDKESLESGEIVSGEWSSLNLAEDGEMNCSKSGELNNTRCEEPSVSLINLNSSNNCNSNSKDLILTMAHRPKLTAPPQTPPTPKSALNATKEPAKLDYSCFNFSSSDISLSESSETQTSSCSSTQGNKTLLAINSLSQCQTDSSRLDQDGTRDEVVYCTPPPVSAPTTLDTPIPNADLSTSPYNSPALQNQSPSVFLNTPSDPLHLDSSMEEECLADSDLHHLEGLTHKMIQSSTWQNLEIPCDQNTSGRTSGGHSKQLSNRSSCSTSPRTQENDSVPAMCSDRHHPQCDADPQSHEGLSRHSSSTPCEQTHLDAPLAEALPQQSQPTTNSSHHVQQSLSPNTTDYTTHTSNTHWISHVVTSGSMPNNPGITPPSSTLGAVLNGLSSAAEVIVLDSSHNYFDEHSNLSFHAAEVSKFISPSSPVVTMENCVSGSLSEQENNQSLEEGEITCSDDATSQDGSFFKEINNSGNLKSLGKKHPDVHCPSVPTPSRNHGAQYSRKRDHKRYQTSGHHKDKLAAPVERTKSRHSNSRKESSYRDKHHNVCSSRKNSFRSRRIL